MPIITTQSDHGSCALAFANANIALVKYWGKANRELNIPAVPSLSFTLDQLGTFTHLETSPDQHDHLLIKGQTTSAKAETRLRNFLDYFRQTYDIREHFLVSTRNNIPYGAGLASSASAYASISMALNHFCGLDLDARQLSILARVGSASAARSIAGGFVALPGSQDLSHDAAFATCVDAKLNDWKMLIVIGDTAEKQLSSREAMKVTKETSPFFEAFVESSEKDFVECQKALLMGDLEKVGTVMEHSTMKMHASMWAASPPINYLKPFTMAVVDIVKEYRRQHGPVAFFTMDAGPNVKILCEDKHTLELTNTIRESDVHAELICSSLGGPAQILEAYRL